MIAMSFQLLGGLRAEMMAAPALDDACHGIACAFTGRTTLDPGVSTIDENRGNNTSDKKN
jgi:hypothetical protein